MTAPRKRAAKRAAPKASQRDRLMGRPRPSAVHRFLVDAEGEVEAQRELSAARKALLRNNSGTSAHRAAEKRVADAEAAVEACFEAVTLRALPTQGEVTWESLAAQHPPTAEQLQRARKKRDEAQQKGEELPEWPQYGDSFWPAVMAACAESDMTEDDWATFLAEHVSDGELSGLKLALIDLNQRERTADPALPFDLTRIAGLLSKSR